MKLNKRDIIIFAASIATAAIITVIIFSVDRHADTPTDMLSLGERYLLEMEYEQALVQFLAVIEIEPNNVRAYIGASEAYVGLGQRDSAAGILRQGLEQTGSEAIAWALVELDPDNSGIYLEAADFLVSFGDNEAASEILRVGFERIGDDEIIAAMESLFASPSNAHSDSPEQIINGDNYDAINTIIELPPSFWDELQSTESANYTGRPAFGMRHLIEWQILPDMTRADVEARLGFGFETIHDGTTSFRCCKGVPNSSNPRVYPRNYASFDNNGRISEVDTNFFARPYSNSPFLQYTAFYPTIYCDHLWPNPLPFEGMSATDIMNYFQNDSEEALTFFNEIDIFTTRLTSRLSFELYNNHLIHPETGIEVFERGSVSGNGPITAEFRYIFGINSDNENLSKMIFLRMSVCVEHGETLRAAIDFHDDFSRATFRR